MAILLDASAALAWLIDRPLPAEIECANRCAEAVLSQEALVPPLWFSEVANGILKAERLLNLSPQLTQRYLAFLEALPINVDSNISFAQQSALLMLARIHGISAYDAAYLELALRTGSTLATFDQRLAYVADHAGVTVFA